MKIVYEISISRERSESAQDCQERIFRERRWIRQLASVTLAVAGPLGIHEVAFRPSYTWADAASVNDEANRFFTHQLNDAIAHTVISYRSARQPGYALLRQPGAD